MPTKIKILSFLFFPILLFSQEDSTVNLLPHFKKGDLLNYTLSTSLLTQLDGEKKLKSEVYILNLELLKSAYGLSVFNAIYSSESEKEKSGLEVYFTIDSNKRFVAIENKSSLLKEFNRRKIDSVELSLDSINFESYFSELELIFFLNGAKYKIGEVYHSETLVLNAGELISADIKVEMTRFDRQSNRFEIKVNILPKDRNESNISTNYTFVFILNTLKLIELNSEQHYFFKGEKYQKNLTIKTKTD